MPYCEVRGGKHSARWRAENVTRLQDLLVAILVGCLSCDGWKRWDGGDAVAPRTANDVGAASTRLLMLAWYWAC
jgi:hypothetical protein